VAPCDMSVLIPSVTHASQDARTQCVNSTNSLSQGERTRRTASISCKGCVCASRFHCESPLRNEAVAAAVIRASGRPAELDRIMTTAAEAARASSPPAMTHVTEVQAGTATASSAAASQAAVMPTPDAGSAGDSAPGPVPGAPALIVRRAA
jgi:hypothetical protein